MVLAAASPRGGSGLQYRRGKETPFISSVNCTAHVRNGAVWWEMMIARWTTGRGKVRGGGGGGGGRESERERNRERERERQRNYKCKSFSSTRPLNLPFESGEMELDITLDMCIRGWVTARRSDLGRKREMVEVGGGVGRMRRMKWRCALNAGTHTHLNPRTFNSSRLVN